MAPPHSVNQHTQELPGRPSTVTFSPSSNLSAARSSSWFCTLLHPRPCIYCLGTRCSPHEWFGQSRAPHTQRWAPGIEYVDGREGTAVVNFMTINSEGRPIWVVEDSPADVDLVRYAFAQHGVSSPLEVYADGESAIKKIEELERRKPCGDCLHTPLLAVLDVNLPRRSGLEVLKRMRESPLFAKMPVIVFTSAESEREHALSVGFEAQAFILKGLELDDFTLIGDAVKKMLRSAEAV